MAQEHPALSGDVQTLERASVKSAQLWERLQYKGPEKFSKIISGLYLKSDFLLYKHHSSKPSIHRSGLHLDFYS